MCLWTVIVLRGAACFAHCLRTFVLLSVESWLLCAADSCSLSIRNELKLILWQRRSLIQRVFKWSTHKKKIKHFGPPHAESFVLVNRLKGGRKNKGQGKKQKYLPIKGTVKAIFRSTLYNAVTRLPPGRSEFRNPVGSSDFLDFKLSPCSVCCKFSPG
jgi:hypothetical protein